MKKIIIITLTAFAFLSSCKKDTTAPKVIHTNDTTITMNFYNLRAVYGYAVTSGSPSHTTNVLEYGYPQMVFTGQSVLIPIKWDNRNNKKILNFVIIEKENLNNPGSWAIITKREYSVNDTIIDEAIQLVID
jgi:hypothetical protein